MWLTSRYTLAHTHTQDNSMSIWLGPGTIWFRNIQSEWLREHTLRQIFMILLGINLFKKSTFFFNLRSCCSNYLIIKSSFSQFSRSVMSNSLQPNGLQHASLPCPSPTSGAYSNSCPLNQWCHPTISSSVAPFSSSLQYFPASASFQMSQFFPSGGQSIGVSSSASVFPMSIQDWVPLGWTGWISLQSKRLSRIFSNTTVQKHQFFSAQFLCSPTLTSIHDYWKNHGFD